MLERINLEQVLDHTRVAKSREVYKAKLEALRIETQGTFYKLNKFFEGRVQVPIIMLETLGNKPRQNFYGWTWAEADIGEVSDTFADVYIKRVYQQCGEKVKERPNPFRVRINSLKVFVLSPCGWARSL